MELIFLDYASLKIIWWLLIGLILIVFSIMDGHDMGVATLLPFVAHNDVERRVVINTIAPHWDGNQVWLITGGAGMFAAWPMVYATAFSGFYWAMLLALWALFLRPVGFDYRSKIHHPLWRCIWDWGLFVGGFVPPIIFGVVFGNLLQGVPFYLDDMLLTHYEGSFWELLNPLALLCGVLAAAMYVFHGAVYLNLRCTAELQQRCQRVLKPAAIVVLVAFSVAGLWMIFLDGYRVVSDIVPNALPNPHAKTVERQAGAWLLNDVHMPLLFLLPVSVYAAVAGVFWSVKRGRNLLAFACSSLMLAGVIATYGASSFPFMIPSSLKPSSSLTVWDASSSHLTLWVMLLLMLIFMPLVLFYTSWAYRVMSGKVTNDDIRNNEHSLY